MAIRNAEAIWEGTLREGDGSMKFGTFEGAYSFASRFEEGTGTNPEELLGAAHAGCYSMALSGDLVRAGFTPGRIATRARVHLGKVNDQWRITKIELDTEAEVPGITPEQFQEIAEAVKTSCPVSVALSAVEISLTARLR
jgi:osmotically inducible protein OsmC